MANERAIEATVTGHDQEVGFRALVMKQAIQYNLGGSAKNEPNHIVQFTLQGHEKRVDLALERIPRPVEDTGRAVVAGVPALPYRNHGGDPLHRATESVPADLDTS